MQIEKTTLHTFRNDFNRAVKELEEKYDVRIDMGSIKYSASTFSFKVDVVNDENLSDRPTHELKYEAEFKRQHLRYNLASTALGKEFYIRATKYILIGVTQRACKYPIIAKRVSNGKLYKLPAYDVREALLNK